MKSVLMLGKQIPQLQTARSADVTAEDGDDDPEI
jgi:hypothetical protein